MEKLFYYSRRRLYYRVEITPVQYWITHREHFQHDSTVELWVYECLCIFGELICSFILHFVYYGQIITFIEHGKCFTSIVSFNTYNNLTACVFVFLILWHEFNTIKLCLRQCCRDYLMEIYHEQSRHTSLSVMLSIYW